MGENVKNFVDDFDSDDSSSGSGNVMMMMMMITSHYGQVTVTRMTAMMTQTQKPTSGGSLSS